jgi:hypothetical protein
MNELETLEQYALDHYEDGGHWIYETFSASDYARSSGRGRLPPSG